MGSSSATRWGWTAACGSVALLAASSGVRGQCQYEVTIIQYPLECGSGTVITRGLGLNDHGAVVGRYRCSTALGRPKRS